MGFSFLLNWSNDHKNFEVHLLDYIIILSYHPQFCSFSHTIKQQFTLGRCQKLASSYFRRYIFDPVLEKKGFTLTGSKNDIVSKNNLLLFFVVYIQLMIFVALSATWKPKQC